MTGSRITSGKLNGAAAALLQLAAGVCLAGQLWAQSPPVPAAETEQPPGAAAAPEPGPETVAAQADTVVETADLVQAPMAGEADTEELITIADYQARIDDLESRYGAYHADLSEAALGLGVAQQLEGNHEEAVSSLQRAVQVNRVNYGLYHVGKIPMIERLIDSYVAMEDWEAADDTYYTLMELYARNYQNTDVVLLPALAKLVKWHLFAYGAGFDEVPLRHVVLAREMLYQAINIVKFNYGPVDLRQLEFLAAMVLTDYYMAVAQLQFQEEPTRGTINSFREPNASPYSDAWAPFQNMFTQGKNHIVEMIRITQANPSTPPRTVVDAIILLADWNLLFKKKVSADETYRRAWDLIVKLEDHEEHVEEIFGEPTSLPSLSITGTSFGEAEKTSARPAVKSSRTGLGAIVIEFDITTSGRAIGAEVVEADPGATKGDIVKAKRQLRRSRFRPRYENGVAVENPNVQIRYLFEPEPEPVLAEADNEE